MDALTERPGQALELPEALPADEPLAMPVQSLWSPRRVDVRPETRPRAMALRRFYVIGGTAVVAALAVWEMYDVLAVGGITLLEAAVLALYASLIAWIAFAFVSALAGFISLVGRGGLGLGIDPRAPLPALRSRTALLLPCYNEDPGRVAAGLQAMHEELQATGRAEHFDFFILSDTTDPDIWVAEEAAWLALRDRLPDAPRIFYRHRPKNVERKAGNIADWVRRFGGAYQQMMILDADSVMEGGTIVRLAAAMEAHLTVGLIQTLPFIVNGQTLFARLLQFAGRVYGPIVAHGIAWWHGTEGNYWGHNAMVRTRAFASEAGLPVLSGRKPFGGHIMSHDFVEAALLRRGGWAVHFVPGLAGSYEESPPSLPDLAGRDRRWCQGNLQHAAVLPARGLHWVSRLHLLTGIGSYITAPLWLVFLTVGMAISVQAYFVPPEYFRAEPTLFPIWPAQDPVRAVWVFVGTMAMLLMPKLLGFVALLVDGPVRRGAGGALRAFVSLLVEVVLSGLLAPLLMLTQSRAVYDILVGRDAGWQAQRRDDAASPLRQTVRRYLPHTVIGLVIAAGSYAISLSLLFWMSPIIAGLVLSIPLVLLTSSRVGRSLLRVPEETSPPPVLTRYNQLRQELKSPPANALTRLHADQRLLALHRALLPPSPDLDTAQATLSKPEVMALVADRAALDRVLTDR
jgi:membrane glycosyltransferase